MTDGALKEAQGKPVDQIEATPLCLMFGQGHQHFLQRLAAVPAQASPPSRGRCKAAEAITPERCLAEALFEPWARPDSTMSFRWDVAEDVRYALQFGDPSEAKNKLGTQHGANRLAALALAGLPVSPVEVGRRHRPTPPGGRWLPGAFAFEWPLCEAPMSLDGWIAVLGSSKPPVDAPVMQARRISVGKFMSFTAGHETRG